MGGRGNLRQVGVAGPGRGAGDYWASQDRHPFGGLAHMGPAKGCPPLTGPQRQVIDITPRSLRYIMKILRIHDALETESFGEADAV
jgi:hypothetical protein